MVSSCHRKCQIDVSAWVSTPDIFMWQFSKLKLKQKLSCVIQTAYSPFGAGAHTLLFPPSNTR